MKGLKKLCRRKTSGTRRTYLEAATAWIANFGVVPLFLLAAFLLAPMFFFFLNLLLFVTHVLETIRQLLFSYDGECNKLGRRLNYNKFNSAQYSGFKPSFLPIFRPCVKGIVVSFIHILLLTAPQTGFTGTDLIIAKGESTSLTLPDMNKFNIGNKEVLTYRYDEKRQTLIMRGARIGHTEILVWKKGQETPDKHQIFVITKIQEAKFLHLAELLGSLGVETRLHLPHLKTSGEIKSIQHYFQYRKVLTKNPEVILDGVSLSKTLKQQLIAEIYRAFFNDYKDNISCTIEFSDLLCSYPVNDAPAESLKKRLTAKYGVQFIERNEQRAARNYFFKLRLIQLEQLDGEELRLGLDQLSTNLGDLLRLPLRSIIEKNAVLLSQQKVQLNTLAEPQGLIRPQSPAEFQIGADVPYQSASGNGTVSQTQWQFAGLKVKLKLENMGDRVRIDYETELTRPDASANNSQVSISGNKERSSIVIDLKSPTQMFQITLRTDASGTDQMPYLNRIPVIGELFKSKSRQDNFKSITGIIEVAEHE